MQPTRIKNMIPVDKFIFKTKIDAYGTDFLLVPATS